MTQDETGRPRRSSRKCRTLLGPARRTRRCPRHGRPPAQARRARIRMQIPAPRSHCAGRSAIAAARRPNNASRSFDLDALRGEIGRRVLRVCRMVRQLTPMPMAAVERIALALDQDAGDLAAGAQHVVRPFECEAFSKRRAPPPRRRHGARGPATKPSCGAAAASAGSVSRQRGMKIARRRNPWPAAPAASGGLVPRDDPQRAAFAGAAAPQRFRVGRVDDIEMIDPGYRRSTGNLRHP